MKAVSFDRDSTTALDGQENIMQSFVSVKKIVGLPFNPKTRLSQDGVRGDLEQSISRMGIQIPLIVYVEKGIYHLLDGHRRLAAAMSLGLGEVPVYVIAKPDNIPAFYSDLNNTGRKVEGLEQIESYLLGGPVPQPRYRSVVLEIEEHQGRKMLERMVDEGVGPRTYEKVKLFVQYSQEYLGDDGDPDLSIREVMEWVFGTGSARALEIAVEQAVEPETVWSAIKNGQSLRIERSTSFRLYIGA